MKIVLMVISALTVCLFGALTLLAVMMLHGGGLGRTTNEDVILTALYTLLNLSILISLLNGSVKLKIIFYILGVIDCAIGAFVIVTCFTALSLVVFGLIVYAKGSLVLTYASRMATALPT